MDRNWDNVIFTDETSMWGYVSRNRTWTTVDNRLVQRTVKHPIKVHVWGCFSKQGFGRLHLFTENLNAQKMVKNYQKCLLSTAKRWFINKNDEWILQEDNDPKCRSRLNCSNSKREKDVQVLD